MSSVLASVPGTCPNSGTFVRSIEWGVLGLAERDGSVVELALADDREGLAGAFDRNAPEAREGERARALADEVARRIETGEGFEDIPAEASGSVFQERVWGELIHIPRGEVVTYGELAARIGYPGAGRAVGAACGANPVALIIPCHRVVGSGGSLGGYRWGPERKTRILRAEGVEREPDPSPGAVRIR